MEEAADLFGSEKLSRLCCFCSRMACGCYASGYLRYFLSADVSYEDQGQGLYFGPCDAIDSTL